MNLRRALGAALLSALVLAACGDDDTGPVADPPEPGATEHPTCANELVLQISTAGGLAAPPLAAIPQISVYGDGRVIVVGPTTLEYPGAALPNLQQGLLSAEELDELVRGAEVAGLLAAEEPDYGDPGVTDMPTTEVTIDAGGVQRNVAAYALDYTDGDDTLEPAQREARQRLRDFLTVVDADVATETYEADAVAVFVRPYDPGEDRGPAPVPHEWPLGDLGDDGELVEGFGDTRCLVIEGADAQTVLAAAGDASAGDPWSSGGVTYSVDFRPLLPDESRCDQLVPAQTAGA
ncbi:MAG: hypothetical protein ACRDY6_07290 [Acidimicrobiia bacterium]